jgi:hypothetical protein
MTGILIILEKIIIGIDERGCTKGREWQVAYHLVGYFRFFCNRGLQNSIATILWVALTDDTCMNY